MSGINRYIPYYHRSMMVEYDSGPFVKHADHTAALKQARIDAVRECLINVANEMDANGETYVAKALRKYTEQLEKSEFLNKDYDNNRLREKGDMSYWTGKQFNVKQSNCSSKPTASPPAPKPKMSEKELVEKALDVIAPKDMENVGGLYDFAERIVDAGWRPPVCVVGINTRCNQILEELDAAQGRITNQSSLAYRAEALIKELQELIYD